MAGGIGRVAGVLGLGAVAATAAAFAVSPRPGAALIKAVFERGGRQVLEKMRPHAPGGVTVKRDIPYREHDADARLDVYRPDGATGPLPVVIWIHGGAWVSGGKKDDVPYFELLAADGRAVVGVDYSLGPHRTYPTALHQLTDAIRYLGDHADELGLDLDRVVIAGDSAGAQLTSQLAALATNPSYAANTGLPAPLHPEQLRGVILYCGIYDVPRLLQSRGLLGWGDSIALRAYTGLRRPLGSDAVQQMSTLQHVTAQFPPAFISGGNADPLTEHHSKALAARLDELGVRVDTLFWPDDTTPELPHEYQFDLDGDAGRIALTRTHEFLRGVLAD
ncbi:acetyl esterase/lipase [Diaminobutyricimonas aerilata]|uniref:Acetyl esterase/lipase n=1 Tax=Diaminobutyricimonas aerilata TaxID=1162967 RepID=A0A2M9CFL2_9MICO|nr:alpha/beta hydrolase [Diaminobutyricimonas aerilata]PJJ70734.1 acetyl esterase/lipase [Diaminobutyricimonas aerilata]